MSLSLTSSLDLVLAIFTPGDLFGDELLLIIIIIINLDGVDEGFACF